MVVGYVLSVLDGVAIVTVDGIRIEVAELVPFPIPNSGPTWPPSRVLFQTNTTSNPEFVIAGMGCGVATHGHAPIAPG